MNFVSSWLRTAAKDFHLDCNPGQQCQHHAGGDHAHGSLHSGAADKANKIDQRPQVPDIERGFFAIKTDIGERALRAFLGGARQNRFELGVRNADETLIGTGVVSLDCPFAVQPIFVPQRDVWSAAKYPSCTRK